MGQREAQTLKRVGDEVFRIQQKITAERTAREAAIVLMKDDFMAAHKAREKADEVFKSEMLRKMAVVEKGLEVETKNREASEEQLVNPQRLHARAAGWAAHRQPGKRDTATRQLMMR